MSQHDMNIENQGFPAFRSDLNNALAALASTSAGATAPSTTFAQQLWYDSTANLLKMRNTDNDAWITLAYFDQTNDEWEIRSAVIQAVDSAGVIIKTDDGTTRIEVQDDGDVSIDSGTLFVDASNNRVGVGTTSPSKTLDVRGTSATNLVSALFTTTAAGASDDSNTIFLGCEGNDERGITITAFKTNSSGAHELRFGVSNNGATPVEQVKIDKVGGFYFNSGFGSVATAYGCRAWVNFSGEGTVAIRASGNVSSLTDDGTGNYTINFTTAMPDLNYCVTGTSGLTTGSTSSLCQLDKSAWTENYRTQIATRDSSFSRLDTNLICVSVFR